MSRGKPVWALFAALAAALLALQFFTHSAPFVAVHNQETATSRGEALVCDDTHSAGERSEHFLTRDRHRADEHASDGRSHSTQAMDTNAVAASAPDTNAHSGQRPASDNSPAVIQVFRC